MSKWLKDAIFYQIYPTSFYDSNGDGTGDLKGITAKLQYLSELGVNAVWLNPFFKSPFKDGGYDVSDFTAVDKRFGTMEDFEELIKGCKLRGIRVVIDLVIGHTSVRHNWFKQSAKDKRNKYSDYYIWTDSIFTKYQDKTIHGMFDRNGGFYINYYALQPALNFGFNSIEPKKTDTTDIYAGGEDWKMHYTDPRLAPLREEMLNIMRFWLDKGVDGFRVDMANSLVKGCVYNSENSEDIAGLIWVWDKLLGQIRSEYEDVAFIAEWIDPLNSVGKSGFDLDFLSHDTPSYNTLFRSEKGTNLLPALEQGNNYFSEDAKGDISAFAAYAKKLHTALEGKGYFSAPTGSHDQVRIAEGMDEGMLKVIFAFLLTYKHVPFIYYGDEIGMRHNFNVNKDGGFIRTGARTPFQWDKSAGRGFSTAKKLYLPVNGTPDQCVDAQLAREDSLLVTVKNLIRLRKRYSCLNADGELNTEVIKNNGYPYVFSRTDAKNSIVVAINPSADSHEVDIPYKEVLLSYRCGFRQDGIKLSAKSFAILLR